MWTDTSGCSRILWPRPCLPGSHRTSEETAKDPHLWSQETRVPDLVQLLCPAKFPAGPSPPGIPKAPHINCPQLNSPLCPQRSVSLSGTTPTLPTSPARNRAVIRACSHPHRPHSQSLPAAQSGPLTAAPGQASPSSDAAITPSLSDSAAAVPTLKSILCTD